jgi:hypothetical protein
MPATPIIISSLVEESADIVTICEYVSDEIAEILATEQVNASVITDLDRVKTVMDELVTYFGG